MLQVKEGKGREGKGREGKGRREDSPLLQMKNCSLLPVCSEGEVFFSLSLSINPHFISSFFSSFFLNTSLHSLYK